jgi:hypothetical protein
LVLPETFFPIVGISRGEPLPVPMAELFLKGLLKKLRLATGGDETCSHEKFSPDCTPVQFGGAHGVPVKMPNQD